MLFSRPVTFLLNKAEESGAAVYLISGGDLVSESSLTFDSNSAGAYGGIFNALL
jgi:hypothetical protein